MKRTQSGKMRKLLLLLLTLTISLSGWATVDTRIFDGSTREQTEAEEKEQGEIDPDARTGWKKDDDESAPKETDNKQPAPPEPSGLPQPPEPEPRRGLPEPPEPSQPNGENPPAAAEQPSMGVRASPQLQGISLDIALPFPSDI